MVTKQCCVYNHLDLVKYIIIVIIKVNYIIIKSSTQDDNVQRHKITGKVKKNNLDNRA